MQISDDQKNKLISIYSEYVKEIKNVTDIKRWASKKTVTSKVLTSERTNELNVKNALEGTDYAEGDKVYMYYDINDKLKLVEQFNNDYSKVRLLKKLFETSKLFDTILDKSLFVNYSLKRNNKALEEL